MILPTKGITPDRSILSVGSDLLDLLDSLDWQLHPNTSHIHPYMYG